MQKTIYVMASLCLLLFFSSCRKFELIKDHIGGGNSNTIHDFIQVKENRIEYDLGEILDLHYPYQVKKIYYADGKKLKQVITTYPIYDYPNYAPYDTLDVKESLNRTDFVNQHNDTIASIRLNSSGKPISARASNWMISGEAKLDFTFFYSSGRLSEIKVKEQGQTKTYAKIEYESNGKNVRSISHASPDGAVETVTYTYDHTKKVKAQFIPSENNANNFWAFLKYLNIFEELQPENILVSSYFETDIYGMNKERTYWDHGFDLEGRLIKFTCNGTKWYITWK